MGEWGRVKGRKTDRDRSRGVFNRHRIAKINIGLLGLHVYNMGLSSC